MYAVYHITFLSIMDLVVPGRGRLVAMVMYSVRAHFGMWKVDHSQKLSHHIEQTVVHR
jgi:hypothetical protein